MEDDTIDMHAAMAAVRQAMERLAAHNLRACSISVVDTAVRILQSECRGRITFLRAVEIVKTAVVAMGEAGELEWHVESHKEWTLLTRRVRHGDGRRPAPTPARSRSGSARPRRTA